MQPLISPVDHESRHNSYRAEGIPSEDTPLLSYQRFPPERGRQRSPVRVLLVVMLVSILIAGVAISIYLLNLQSKSENVIPDDENALQLVMRSQWDADYQAVGSKPLLRSQAHPTPYTANYQAQNMVVVQTGTETCHDTPSCIRVLQKMQTPVDCNDKSAPLPCTKEQMQPARQKRQVLPYNFLVSSNGQVYENLGWNTPSPLYSDDEVMLLAFIGEFSNTHPTDAQYTEAESLAKVSVRRNHLHPSFSVYPKFAMRLPRFMIERMDRSAIHFDQQNRVVPND